MIISDVQWTSRAAFEAEVVVTDGEITCAAYCQPCHCREGDRVSEPLHIFGLRSAMISDAEVPYIQKIAADGLSQRGAGRLVDLSEQRIAIGGLAFVFGDGLPGGISVGDMVEFECARIDLW